MLRKLFLFFITSNALMVGECFSQCSTEDTIALAKQGYKKNEIEKMCAKGSAEKSKNKSITSDAEFARIASGLSQLFDAQFHLDGKGKYTRTVIDKKTSARVEKKKIYFETQIQGTTYGEGGTSSSGGNNISYSALLSDLDPDSIVIRGEVYLGDMFNYDITIKCKGGARCATRTDNGGTYSSTEISGDYMPSRKNELIGMTDDIKYLIRN